MNSGTLTSEARSKDKPVLLMLQGLATPYFAALAERLIASDADVIKINYCGGDWFFSRTASQKARFTNFTAKYQTLADFYKDTIERTKPSAVLLFGDCRPIHKTAIAVAKSLSIPVYVFEEGYTRPGYITLEQGGTNDYSSLPRTAAGIRKRATEINEDLVQTPHQAPSLPNPMPRRVSMDLIFHACNILGWPFFRGYQTHRPNSVWSELKGWAQKLRRSYQYRSENRAAIHQYESGTLNYFLVPLQLNSDYQIREHSPYTDVPSFIADVVQSFSENAPSSSHLLFKAHPLDNGIINYRSLIMQTAQQHGTASRTSYIEGGDLDTLLANCAGTVMINSTVGYAALQKGTPLKVMGRALYNMAGLTNTQPLDNFWIAPQKPDINLVQQFITVVRHDSQLYGDFFTKEGISLAAGAAAKRLLADLQD